MRWSSCSASSRRASLTPNSCRCSTIGPSASAGTNVSAPTSTTCRRAARRTAACASAACRRDGGTMLLARQRAGDREHRDDEPVARERTCRCRAPCCRTACSPMRPANALPLLLRRRRERVEDLAEAVRAGVGDACLCRRRSRHAIAVPTSTSDGGIRIDERRHLHLVGLDLLAEVLGRAADHQPGDEHRDDREHEHAVEARADAAEDRPRRAASATSARARRAA